MTWQEWVRFVIAIIGFIAPVLWYVRNMEKKVDRHDHTLYGERGDNGHKGRIAELEKWQDYLRAELPKLIQESQRHTMGNVRMLTDDFEKRLRAMERRPRG